MVEPAAGDTVIEVEGLRFRYASGQRDALAGLDLTVRRGEFVGITGPSGAGKSTLCLCLKGLIPAGAFSGRIEVAGQPVTRQSPFVESSALVFQDPETQIIGLTVAEDVAFGPENLKREPGEIRAAITEALRLVRLDSYEATETYQLSGGQKQRLAIAGALVLDPQILILDEPTSELDPVGKDEVFEVIAGLRRERDVTVIMVEHAAEHLAEIADRIIVMDDGRIVDQGPPARLYRNAAIFHRTDGERAPQIAQVLYELLREGLIDESEFSAREEDAVRLLISRMSRSRRRLASHG
jgi:energy-coupling factor transporter ATP-binding protein EcfA2